MEGWASTPFQGAARCVHVLPRVVRYLAQVSEHYPACRSLEGGGTMPLDDSSPAGPVPTTHQKLLHK